ncbi:MAG: hypothetical protein WBR26_06705 [Candidatus Acidiferrum sp.]
MFRWAAAFSTAALTAVFLVLFEPALAASDVERLFLIWVLVMLFRSPIWLTSTFRKGAMGAA